MRARANVSANADPPSRSAAAAARIGDPLDRTARMRLGHAPHVDDDVAMKIARQLHAVAVHVLRIITIFAAMEDDDFVPRAGERTHDVRARESSPADDDDLHLGGEHAVFFRNLDDGAAFRIDHENSRPNPVGCGESDCPAVG